MGTKPQPTRLERPKKEPLDRLDDLLNAGSILESIADAIVVIAQDGMIIRVNAQTEKLFGYARDELVGRSVETLLPERARHQHVDSRRDYSANPCPRPMGLGMELCARRKDGQELPVEISLSPLKTAEGLFVISSIRDITERKELEQVLQQRQQQLMAFFENSATDISLKDAEGRYLLTSRQFEKTYGLARGEAEGKLPHDIFPKDFADLVRAQDLAVLKTGELMHQENVVPDSEPPVTLLVSKFPIVAETGETIGLGRIAADITERKRAEQALVESEARHRLLLETTNALPWEANAKNWCFTYVGPQAVKLFGYPLEQWYERDFWVEHIHSEDREYAIDFCLKSSQRCQDFEFEYRMIAADGRSVWLQDIVSVVCENGVPHSLRGFMVDISNRKQAEEDVRMAQKDAAMHRDRLAHLVRVQTLGEMAAGIAHEINQPLAAIDSYAQACQRRLLSGIDNPEKLEELLGKIAGQAKRAGHVVSRLRAMMQRRTVEPNRTNINTLLQEVVSLAETDARLHDCRLDLKPCAVVTYVTVDAIQIQQVVLNLIRNGIEAMEKIARGNEKVIIVDATKSDADHIAVNVADCGVGVVVHSEADDVFEPFYSTKHSGMGMGLAISRNIIRAHGGEIWYSRNRACGTTFHFSLPVETSEI